MSSKSAFEELVEIKNNFYRDRNIEKLFRNCYALIICRERTCNQLRKKVNLLEEEIYNLKKKLNKNTQ